MEPIGIIIQSYDFVAVSSLQQINWGIHKNPQESTKNIEKYIFNCPYKLKKEKKILSLDILQFCFLTNMVDDFG